MRPVHVLGVLVLLAGTAWADSLERYHDGDAWKVFRVVHSAGAWECYMRSAVDPIDRSGNPEPGFTFLEMNASGGRVWFSGEARNGYFRDTRSTIQVDDGPPIAVAFGASIREPSLVDRMKAGKSAVVTVAHTATGARDTYTFSLIGFTKALKALAQCERTPD